MKKYASVIVWFAAVAIFMVAWFIVSGLGDGASAIDYSYYIQNYEVRYEYESGRTFKVTENITAVFNVYGKHGIIRDLPYNSDEVYTDIRSDDAFDVQLSGGFISVYLGDENYTVPANEPISYTLEYSFKLPASAGKDTVYLNLIGGGWTTNIESATCVLVLPEAPAGNILINDSEFKGDYSVNGNTVTVNVQDLSPFSPVTVQCDLPAGTMGSMAPDAGEIAALVIAAVLLAATIVLAIVLPKNEPTPVVNFTPPDGIDPLLAGAMIDGTVQNGDITSLIYYWADKKKLLIDLTDEKDPVLRKRDDLDEGASEYEQIVFARLFRGGDTVAISSLANSFYQTAEYAKKLVTKKTPKMFSGKSTALAAVAAVAAALMCFATVLFRGLHIHSSVWAFDGAVAAVPFAAIFAIGYWSQKNSFRISKKMRVGIFIGQLAIAAVLTVAAVFLLPQTLLLSVFTIFLCLLASGTAIVAPFLLRHNKAYIDELNPLLGFREFIRLAEKERLELLLEQDPEFYYHILPYAQVLGVSDIWEEKFKDIKMDPPVWAIAPNDALFNFIVLNAAMRSATRNMASTFVSRPASSGRSGGGRFGGGGGGSFRGGGGFGGGGGRSW